MSVVDADPKAGALAEPVAGGRQDVAARGFLRRLLRKPLAVACLAYLAVVVLVAVLAPILLPDVARENAGDLVGARQGPSGEHLLGTDSLGRDVGQRLLVGTRMSVIGIVQALAVILALGVPLGLLAGYLGGWTDRLVSWLADMTFSLPGIVVLLVVLAVFPQSLTAAMLAFGVIAAPALMRVVRSATLPVREELYVAAARVAGLSRAYIMSRHILPRIAGPVIVQTSLLAASVLLVQTALAFLGLVVLAPAPSWGGMLAEGVNEIVLQPWLIWPPGLVVAATVLALGLLADAVRDATTEGWAPELHRPRRTRSPRGERASHAPPAPMQPRGALLAVEGVTVRFDKAGSPLTVVDDVSFEVRPGETVALVGESGCGKTMTAMAILGLLPSGGRVAAGRIAFGGVDLAACSESELRRVRGSEIALISQEPMVSLNPVLRVGSQLTEVLRRHHHLARGAARERALELLRQVHLPDPEAVMRRYPYELSGGMAQRVGIARALAGDPRLLVADEPTTALDVTVQAEILDLLRELQRTTHMAVLLVTHDWGVVADACDRAVVMYAGQVVERADVAPLFGAPLHPYTEALMAANPHSAAEGSVLPTIPGSVPAPGEWPSGCHFHPRCRYRTPACEAGAIALQQPMPERATRCIHHDQLPAER